MPESKITEYKKKELNDILRPAHEAIINLLENYHIIWDCVYFAERNPHEEVSTTAYKVLMDNMPYEFHNLNAFDLRRWASAIREELDNTNNDCQRTD